MNAIPQLKKNILSYKADVKLSCQPYKCYISPEPWCQFYLEDESFPCLPVWWLLCLNPGTKRPVWQAFGIPECKIKSACKHILAE